MFCLFASRDFIVSGLVVRSLFYFEFIFEFIFLYGVSVPLSCISVFVPVLYCFDNFSFVILSADLKYGTDDPIHKIELDYRHEEQTWGCRGRGRGEEVG